MSVAATEIIGEVIDPFTGILGTAEELAKVAGYQVLREAVELRNQDTNGDRGLSDHWLPTDSQLQTMRESIGPILPYLSARKRLISSVDNPKALEDLDPHQADLFANYLGTISQYINPSQASVCIVGPTGTGKSYMMGKFIEALHPDKDEPAPQLRRTLVLTPTNANLKQIKDDISKRYPHIPIGTYNMENKQLDEEVTVMTYSSFLRATKDGIIEKGDFTQVLLDEADMALAPDTRAKVKDFTSRSVCVGFTATPENGEFRKVSDLFENVIYDIDTKSCIEAGRLSATQVWLVDSGESIDIGKIQRFKDIPTEKLNELGMRASRAARSTAITRDFVGAGMKGLVKCAPGDNCAVAIERASQLNNIMVTDEDGTVRRIRAVAVGSSIKNSQELIDAYKRGEYDVLCYVKMIGRGFDDVDTDFFIDECPTLSPVEGTQGPGRALRFRPDKIAHIVHIVDELTSDGVPVKAFTMLNVLGVDKYEAGMFIGPNDNWRKRNKQGELKPYEALELFSHELANVLRQTEARIMRNYLLSPEDNRDIRETMDTVNALAKELEITPTVLRTFLNKYARDIAPQQIGRRTYYDRRIVDVYRDFKSLGSRNRTPEKNGWIPYNSLSETFRAELRQADPFLAPIYYETYGRNQGSNYLAPSQWREAQKYISKFVERDRETDGKQSCFNITGDTPAKLISKIDGRHGQYHDLFITPETIKNLRYNIDPFTQPDGDPDWSKWKEYNDWDVIETRDKTHQAVLSLLAGSPLLQSVSANQARLQTVFDEAQEKAGTRGRVVAYTDGIYETSIGRYVTDQERSQIVERISEEYKIDPFDNKRYSFDDVVDEPKEIGFIDAVDRIGSLINWLSTSKPDHVTSSGRGKIAVSEIYLDVFRCVSELETTTRLFRSSAGMGWSEIVAVFTIGIPELKDRLKAAIGKYGFKSELVDNLFEIGDPRSIFSRHITETGVIFEPYVTSEFLKYY